MGNSSNNPIELDEDNQEVPIAAANEDEVLPIVAYIDPNVADLIQYDKEGAVSFEDDGVDLSKVMDFRARFEVEMTEREENLQERLSAGPFVV